jgi:threonine dehydrogenase-like Zn-dependent dehydrogenase
MTSVRVWSDVAARHLVLRDPQDRKPEHRRAKVRSVYSEDKVINRTAHLNLDDDLFLEEVIDTVGFTRMDVTFECSGDVPPSSSPIFEEIREKAIRIVQRFLRAYRTVSEQVDVKVPSKNESPIVEVGVATDYIFNQKCPVKTRIDSVGCGRHPVRSCNGCLETLAARASSRTG